MINKVARLPFLLSPWFSWFETGAFRMSSPTDRREAWSSLRRGWRSVVTHQPSGPVLSVFSVAVLNLPHNCSSEPLWWQRSETCGRVCFADLGEPAWRVAECAQTHPLVLHQHLLFPDASPRPQSGHQPTLWWKNCRYTSSVCMSHENRVVSCRRFLTLSQQKFGHITVTGILFNMVIPHQKVFETPKRGW